jgi:hypothetical protein
MLLLGLCTHRRKGGPEDLTHRRTLSSSSAGLHGDQSQNPARLRASSPRTGRLRSLWSARLARGGGFEDALTGYLQARAAFADVVGERAWRYAEFQLWQEGVACWTENELGRRYTDPAVRTAARDLEARTLVELSTPDLAGRRHLFACPLGAGETMIQDTCNSDWRSEYPHVLSLGPQLGACLPSGSAESSTPG